MEKKNKLDLSNEKDLSKVKKGDILSEFVFDGLLYPSGGVVTKAEGDASKKGLIMEFIVQFPDATYRIN